MAAFEFFCHLCDQFAPDLARIVAHVQNATGIVAALDLERLEQLIHDGLA